MTLDELPDYIERLPPHVNLPADVHVWYMGPEGSADLPRYIETPVVGVLLNKGNAFSAMLPLRPTQEQVDRALELLP